MKFFISIGVMIFAQIVYSEGDDFGVSMIPASFLKPMMYLNWIVRTPFGAEDYVCSLNAEKLAELCQMIFNFQYFKDKYQIKYDENAKATGFKFQCQNKKFDCYLNNYLGFNFNQNMLQCPVTTTQSNGTGNPKGLKNYFVSTDYTTDQVIVLEANTAGNVAAIVGLYKVNLLKLRGENSLPQGVQLT